MMKRRIGSILTALALCLTLLPAAAWATEDPEDVAAGEAVLAEPPEESETGQPTPLAEEDGQEEPTPAEGFVVTGGTLGTDYTYDGGCVTVLTATQLTIANADPGTLTAHRIYVADGVSANITLAGVNIVQDSWNSIAAFEIESGSTGNVTVTLAAGTENRLQSGVSRAGLDKRGSNDNVGTLTIEGPGSLTAIGGNQGAGIGGTSTRNITINGGTITAIGGANAAGIGSGVMNNALDITINGGVITATGGDLAAGIGGGYEGMGDITINGGTITAAGGYQGAGIGGGSQSYLHIKPSTVTINGGTITATGGADGAGIGSGYQSTDTPAPSTVTITGGNVNASSVSSNDTLINGSGTELKLYTLTLSGVDDSIPVTGLTGAAGYGLTDVTTLEGKLYLYLPASSNITQVMADGRPYDGQLDEDSRTGTFILYALEVTGGELGKDYTYENGVLTVLTDTLLTIANKDFDTPTTDRIYVADGVDANITLAGVNIDVSVSFYTAAFEIASNSTGDVTVTLAEGTKNVLRSGYNRAGLQKNGSADNVGTLTIQGSGSLTATGGDQGAGIGGGHSSATRNITIKSGTIVAACSGYYAAGIGSGGISSGGYDCIGITIEGGNITATGGQAAAGIGGGNKSYGQVTITGGTVTATSGKNGAAIGGGSGGYGQVTISGGIVTATAIGSGAGVGDGNNCASTDGFFSTGDSGTNGTAFLAASSITDNDDTSGWSGVIFQGDEGRVYGNVTLPAGEYPVPTGSTLTIPYGASLSGGTLTGSGTFLTENLTEDMISAPTGLVYNGTDLSETIKDRLTLSGVTLCGKTFTITGWTPVVKAADSNLQYTVTYTYGADSAVTITKTVDIAPCPLTADNVTLDDADCIYDGTEQRPTVTVDGQPLLEGVDYTAAYIGNINAGTATVTITGEGNYTGTVTKTFTVAEKLLSADSVALSGGPFTYSGAEQKPAVTVDGQALTEGTDYTAVYSNNINAGTATVTITGIGNYRSTVTKTFTIEKSTDTTSPAKGVGYTIDYAAETITVEEGYEVHCTDNTAVPSGSISDYLGIMLAVRRVENDNHVTSDWTLFTLAARPDAPTALPQTNETLKGQRDGVLSSVDNTMEYRVNDGPWTDVTGSTLTGLAGNSTVEVRVKATAAAPHGKSASYDILEGRPITVTFNHGAQTATGMPGQITDLSYGTKLTQPDAPTAENTDFAFVGWYKDEAGTEAWDFDTDTLTDENVTLYAQWKQVYFSVTVKVENTDHEAYDNATVTLMRGSETIDTVKGGTNGSYSFSKHVEAGMYNVVVTYASDGETQTKTALIEVSGDFTATVTLPPAGVNSRLTVSNDDNTPAVMVGGLDEEAAQIMEESENVSKVTVSMSVEGQQEAEVENTVVEAIAEAIEQADGSSGNTTPIVEYLDVSLIKQIDDSESESLTETTNVIELVVPFDFEGRNEDIVVVRYHDNEAKALEKLSNKPSENYEDGKFFPDKENGYIHIYTQKFSTYAIAYTLTKGYTITLDANDGNVSPDEVTTGTDGKLDMSKLPIPTRSGYTFAGWYTAAEGGTQVTENTLFTKDTTLYAHWTRNGGSGGVATYPVTVTAAQGGSVQASPTQAAQGTTVTLTVTPDQGYRLTTLTATDAKGNEIALTEKGNGQYTFAMPASKVTVAASFAKTDAPCDGGADCPSYHFTDVDPAQWYHSAVDYMVTQGLMNGTAPTKFTPNETTTRAMIVTILYRLAGEPAVTGGTPFTDVKSDQWYTDAIAWAASTGVVNGVTPTTFEPNAAITREQLAAMLWRYAGSPSSSHSLDAFTDAGQISGYAKSALAWANEAHVVNGKGNGRLDPTGNATRAEAAQMLKNFLEAQ